PLISATFARAFLDVNREAFELDPAMFDGPLPAYVNCRSPRVKAGLGTIARVVSRGQEIYGKKLEFSEALERVRDYYVPFHEAVQSTINTTQSAFGACILIDCHSMPSIGLGRLANSANLADFVLGDCYGSACASPVMDEAEAWLVKTGYRVARNSPYAGGFTTRHYGRPTKGVHALQIEINRALYMNETTLRKKPSFQRLQRDMETLVARLGRLDLNGLRAA
ncbi:MAG: N-formylglutamate amidohydrolase, partial [Pseudomonadota bacterium]